jgi:N6-L-threonylcarbamoyladenine synthase
MDSKFYLGIETSCDETAVAVVDGGFRVLSNIVSSQIDIHKKYGGVVPEIASRNHIEDIVPVLDTALRSAGVELKQIAGVFAAAEPGLPGAVMVGRTFAESLAVALNVKYGAINHLYGHIASLKLTNKGLQPPFLALLVSGGHTAVYSVGAGWETKLLIATADDAAGECFDKVGRVLGMEYPAGAKVSKEAEKYSGEPISFTSKFPKDFFSFSGLKTAVLNFVNKERMAGREPNVPQICSGFEKCAVGQLTARSTELIKKYHAKQFGICGGVSANKYLREQMKTECENLGVKFFMPSAEFCGDNGAMIVSAGLLAIHEAS